MEQYISSKKSKFLKPGELHIISIIRTQKKNINNVESSSFNKNSIIRKVKDCEIKGKENSLSSSLTTFRKAMKKNSTNEIKINNKTKKNQRTKSGNNHNAININRNNNEINIHLCLNKGNGNQKNVSNTFEDIIKEKDELIEKLQRELEMNKTMLNQMKNNKINHSKRHNRENINLFLSKTKSTGNITSKNKLLDTLVLFNHIFDRTLNKNRQRVFPKFDSDKMKEGTMTGRDRPKSFSLTINRIFKRNNQGEKNPMSNNSVINLSMRDSNNIVKNENYLHNGDISEKCQEIVNRTKSILKMFTENMS